MVIKKSNSNTSQNPDIKQANKQEVKQGNFVYFRTLVPSIITTLALCAGLNSFRFALEGRYELAVEFIFIAAFLDAIDGRVARALKAESKIGGQLDSLADFFNFGIAPIIMIYLWQLNEIGRLGWLVVILYVVCAALRLAKFNVLQDAISSDESEKMPVWMQNFFVGVPSPVAGVMVLSPLYVSFLGFDMSSFLMPIACLVVIISLLMVSSVPTFSLKHLKFRVPRVYLISIILTFVLIAGALSTFPWIMMLVLCAAYLMSIPIAMRKYRLMERST
ncbi:MAG TPA: CDP-diacylglycerol--serine O-phosphatidyltransferase [Rhodobiaceae bacterium]|nr:CDP-diacylglycerol--serine O-phosphatidyltransferase [Rhodobiaceae bacterium]